MIISLCLFYNFYICVFLLLNSFDLKKCCPPPVKVPLRWTKHTTNYLRRSTLIGSEEPLKNSLGHIFCPDNLSSVELVPRHVVWVGADSFICSSSNLYGSALPRIFTFCTEKKGSGALVGRSRLDAVFRNLETPAFATVCNTICNLYNAENVIELYATQKFPYTVLVRYICVENNCFVRYWKALYFEQSGGSFPLGHFLKK